MTNELEITDTFLTETKPLLRYAEQMLDKMINEHTDSDEFAIADIVIMLAYMYKRIEGFAIYKNNDPENVRKLFIALVNSSMAL